MKDVRSWRSTRIGRGNWPGFPRWPCRSPWPEANSWRRSVTCHDQAAESIAERWVKVGIQIFAKVYRPLSRVASIHLGNPGLVRAGLRPETLPNHTDSREML